MRIGTIMIEQFSVKMGALALLAGGVAACSCVEAPDLDVAPVAVESQYDASKQQVVAAKPQPKVVESKQPVAAVMPMDRVYFAFDSSALSAQAQETLRQVARYAKANNVKGMTVEGHADERGTREYNLALGDRRAVAVKRYLTSLGVDGSNVTTISYGKERPANPGHNEAAWAENRRGVILFNR
jgi:peptidoglycan-associated lipoprotein